MEQVKETISNEAEYQNTLAILADQNRPASILRFLMNKLESYRNSRKIGWSRPWNKYGLMNVQSFKLDFSQDTELLDLAQQVLNDHFSSMPIVASRFIDQLLADPSQLMGFIFVHEYFSEGQTYEGVNLSLGRRTDGKPRYRDRFDLILESPVENGHSLGLSRARVYVDPYLAIPEALWSASTQIDMSHSATHLFEYLTDISWNWAEDSARIWDHWTSTYIDYFGPRQLFLKKSYFYLDENPEGRIRVSTMPPPTEAVQLIGAGATA